MCFRVAKWLTFHNRVAQYSGCVFILTVGSCKRPITKITTVHKLTKQTRRIAEMQHMSIFMCVTHLERCRRWLVDWLLRPPPALSPPPALIVTRDDIFDLNKSWTLSISDTRTLFRFGCRCVPINGTSMRYCDIVSIAAAITNRFFAISHGLFRVFCTHCIPLDWQHSMQLLFTTLDSFTHSLLLFYRTALANRIVLQFPIPANAYKFSIFRCAVHERRRMWCETDTQSKT